MSTVYVLIAINEGKVAECIAIPHDEQNVEFGVRNALFDIYGAANVCSNSVGIGHIPDNIARFLAEKSISARRWNIRPIEDALNARIAELEEFIGKLIEAGESEDSPMPAVWLELVNDWKEREG